MKRIKTDVVVIGAGPGGYAAAFFAADEGKEVILIEKDKLGGVCLNRGCIPSKALIHTTELILEAKESSEKGVSFSNPKIDLKKLRAWKNEIISKLSGGVAQLAKARKVKVIEGRAIFDTAKSLRVETDKKQVMIDFDDVIIATGSKPNIPAVFDLGNKRIMTSTEALELEDIPKKLMVIGGGYIGMELGLVYAGLGSEIVMVEAMKDILMGADRDLVRPVKRKAQNLFKELRLDTKVKSLATKGKFVEVKCISPDGKTKTEKYDKVLVSIGRTPNVNDLGLKDIGIEQDEKGFIKINHKCETNIANVYAIGDVAGGILLAHKASKEARIAVETILGHNVSSEKCIIPAVVFTSPEVAWAGITETEAKENGISVKVAKFPWAASGRAKTLGADNGLTKLIVEKETDRVLGVGIVGKGAGELISEGTLAIEMGATAKDLAEIVHPHPTLSETIMECAESLYGVATHTISKRQ
ncbi:dihydrolipoyl dehydrogenase [Candidatus Marinamargulisbacteria bacterium SCGC AAA071-K20]|nr:dihydrolipoyl dehydrogenase [Candidatus Marinamargulisbacteria bacterium SCGC AAA071-K20]